MNILLIGIGGAFGAIARFGLGKFISQKSGLFFPFGTFIINITGAFLLGIVTRLASGSSIYLLVGDGFLGAFTTFSTFMYEGFHLIKGNRKQNAFIYIFASLIIGVLGFFIGFETAKQFTAFV